MQNVSNSNPNIILVLFPLFKKGKKINYIFILKAKMSATVAPISPDITFGHSVYSIRATKPYIYNNVELSKQANGYIEKDVTIIAADDHFDDISTQSFDFNVSV